MRVAIVGPRDLDLTDADIHKAIEESGYEVDTINTGDAKGVDASVVRYANNQSIKGLRYKANWARYGKQAGPLRNKRMMDNSDALIAFARYDDVVTSGTASSIAEAMVNKIPITIVQVAGR